MRCLLSIGLAMVAFLLGPGGDVEVVSAGDNYALLVGVGDYDVKELRPLKYTRADVLALHERLLTSGFEPENVVLMHDDLEKLVTHYRQLGSQYRTQDYLPLRENIRRELRLLLGRLGRDDSVIVAFAGHGVQFRNEKTSYFCPSDAKLEKKDSLIAFGEVFAELKESAASRRMFLVDACQNDPLSGLARSRATVDLESTTRPQDTSVPEGIIALFSCRAGQKSFEMPELGHGVFFHHLLEAWDGKGDLDDDGKLSYEELAYYTRRETAQYAAVRLKALQTPHLKADFSGEWVLRELPSVPTLFDFAANARSVAEARASQVSWAKSLGQKVVETNSIGMKLTLIPPGEFWMGSPESESNHEGDEQQHRVRITRPFFLGQHEVTVGQFRRFVNATGFRTEAETDGQGGWGWNELTAKAERDPKYSWQNPGYPQTDNHPVVNVNWGEAQKFCEWLSKQEGATYRLPTEAQWEYACRAGTTTTYQHGNDPEKLVEVANVADGTAKDSYETWNTLAARDGYVFTAPVGQFRANAFGLSDMHGNVWEWCADWYDGEYYASSPVDNPAGGTEVTNRVDRGGSWFSSAAHTRAAYRNWFIPEVRHIFVGFRVARDMSK